MKGRDCSLTPTYANELKSFLLDSSHPRLLSEFRKDMLKTFQTYLRNCGVGKRDWTIRRKYLDFQKTKWPMKFLTF